MVVYNNDWFLERIKEVRPNDYDDFEFLEPYVNAKTRIKAIHKPCGEIIQVLPNSFISRNGGCPDCSIKRVADKQRRTTEEFNALLPEGVVAIEEYTGAFNRINVHCSVCNMTYNVVPHFMVKRRGKNNNCTRCAKTYKRSTEEVKAEIRDISNGEYEMISEKYENPQKPLKLKHLSCGRYAMISRASFRKGRRCAMCSTSRGESMVREYLISEGIVFEEQVKFEDLVYISNLSYDFYLVDYDILIEFQGEQHYHPIKHFGGDEPFKKQQIIDTIKMEYADTNGYHLIEIPYTEKSPEKIKNFLSEYL